MIYAIFFDAFLSSNITEMGINEEHVGYFFSLFAAFYTLIAFFVSPMVKKFGARVVSLCSYLTICMGCLLLGPSNII
jgi:predicted MFS family arabinose efflux permease